MDCGVKSKIVMASAALVLYSSVSSFSATRQVENLSRGLSVSAVASGVVVGWRLLGTDDPATEFNLYRDGEKIASIGAKDPTFYADTKGTTKSKYAVAAVVNGVEGKKSEAEVVFDEKIKDVNNVHFPYRTLKLDVPQSRRCRMALPALIRQTT